MIYSYYNATTGQIHAKKFVGPAEWVLANAPPGHAHIEGDFDPTCHRVNVTTYPGAVERFQPESPGPDYFWDGVAWKWVEHPAAAARRQEHEQAMGEIHRLEQMSLRAQRELLLRVTWGTPYRDERLRVCDLNEAIEAQRKKLITS